MDALFRRKPRSASADSHPELLWHIDAPAKGSRVGEGWLLVQGWVAVPDGADLGDVFLRLGDERVAAQQESRPDVEAMLPGRQVAGFHQFAYLSASHAEREHALEVTVAGREHRLPLEFSVVADPPSAPAEAAFPFAWHLDSPRDGPEPAYHSVLVRGWVILPRKAQLEDMFVDHGSRISLAREVRPDLEARYRDDQVVGFRGLVALTPSTNDGDWSIGLVLDGREYRAYLPVSIPTQDRDELFRRKAAKLEKIEPILRCPQPLRGVPGRRACGGKLERIGANGLVCVECSRGYAVTDRNFNFLSSDLRDISGISETANVSSLKYGEWELPGLIEEYADGLILDNGSGLRDVYYPNVVNFEIVDYLTTDVLGIGEFLPFADGAFDAVISIAVLEHVRNPFECASEITRVVRSGGKIFVMVPFLQPYHGYPHHYYNMTLAGLENLFSEQFVIERSGLPPGGEPIWTLPWLLNSYIAGLPPKAAEEFKQLRVSDLLAEGSTYLAENFVRELDQRTAEDLAHVTYLVGTKKR